MQALNPDPSISAPDASSVHTPPFKQGHGVVVEEVAVIVLVGVVVNVPTAVDVDVDVTVNVVVVVEVVVNRTHAIRIAGRIVEVSQI